MQRVLDAIDAFWGYLAAVQLAPLALGIGCHLVKLACTSRAWRNVLVAAYPSERVRWRPIYAAYVAGVGVNAIFPARAGDVVRLYMAHRAIPSSSYTTLVSSTGVLTIVDFTLATGVFAWALTQGVLPGLDVLPDLPSFDFSWLLRHEILSRVVVVVLLVAAIVFAFWVTDHIRELKQRVAQAFAVMRTPGRWLRTVVFWQLCDWGLRLATIWFFLGAFGIQQNLRNVLLVQATQSLATLIPVSPGGIGTEQAFLVFTLGSEAPRTALLAFSVGMRLTLTTVNVIVGFAAILATLRTVRFRRVVTPVDAPGGTVDQQ